MSKVLYIAGYSRSGSTVLSSVLGNHADVVSVGEVTFLLDDWSDPNRQCSCGSQLTDCEFWRGLSLVQVSDLAAIVRNVDRRTIRGLFPPGPLDGTACRVYGDFQKKLFSHIRGRSGKSIIVDSSKSARGAAGRILALKQLADQDVYVLHLVRSGVATLDSIVNTGRNWVIEGHTSPNKFPAARAAVGWTRANAWSSIIGRFLGPARYMLLHYEDFIVNPGVTLQKIGQFAGFDASGLLDKIKRQERFQVGHVIGGNRVRVQQAIEVKASAKSPKPGQLRTRDRLIFALVAGWLQITYGYRKL